MPSVSSDCRASTSGFGAALILRSELHSVNRPSNRPTVSPARRAAFDILRRVDTESAYAAPLIAALPQSTLSREDRALAQELTLGVLRWQSALDYFVERYAQRKIKKLDPAVL